MGLIVCNHCTLNTLEESRKCKHCGKKINRRTTNHVKSVYQSTDFPHEDEWASFAKEKLRVDLYEALRLFGITVSIVAFVATIFYGIRSIIVNEYIPAVLLSLCGLCVICVLLTYIVARKLFDACDMQRDWEGCQLVVCDEGVYIHDGLGNICYNYEEIVGVTVTYSSPEKQELGIGTVHIELPYATVCAFNVCDAYQCLLDIMSEKRSHG